MIATFLPASPLRPSAYLVVEIETGRRFQANPEWRLVGASWKLVGLGTEVEAVYVDETACSR